MDTPEAVFAALERLPVERLPAHEAEAVRALAAQLAREGRLAEVVLALNERFPALVQGCLRTALDAFQLADGTGGQPALPAKRRRD